MDGHMPLHGENAAIPGETRWDGCILFLSYRKGLVTLKRESEVQKKKIFSAKILDFSGRRWYNAS